MGGFTARKVHEKNLEPKADPILNLKGPTVALQISETGVPCAPSSQKRVPQNSACASQGCETGQ